MEILLEFLVAYKQYLVCFILYHTPTKQYEPGAHKNEESKKKRVAEGCTLCVFYYSRFKTMDYEYGVYAAAAS